MKKESLYTLVSILFIIASLVLVNEFIKSTDIIGQKLPPFLPTKQLGIDSIGMFLKKEAFREVFPLSYIKKINGIPVTTEEEYKRIISQLADQTNEINVEFAVPFFSDLLTYSVNIKLYEINYTDYFITFLIPLLFSLTFLLISFYLSILLIKNYDVFSIKKKQMIIAGILLFMDMYFLTLGGLDLVNKKQYLPILYISFGITGIILNIFFYYITTRRDKFWIYLMCINIVISFIFLTSYIVFFKNVVMLLSFVKLNYFIIFLNVLIGVLYLTYNVKKETNIIERERQKILTFVLLIPTIIIAVVFLLQSLSLQILPISLFLLFLILLSPAIVLVINDHNALYSKARITFSFVTSLTVFVFLLMLTNILGNIPEKAIIIFGIYVIPSTLFISMSLLYGVNFYPPSISKLPEIPIEMKEQSLKKSLFTRLKKNIPSISKVEIAIEYPTTYSERDFIVSPFYKEIWEVKEKKGYITRNDSIFIKDYERFKSLFDNTDIDYIFFFDMDNNKGFVGIKTKKGLSSKEIDQIKTIVDLFSIDLHSFSILTVIKLMKVLNLEFELLRQSQNNLLRSNKETTIPTSLGNIKIVSHWEPITELAGDIYGTSTFGEYITSWISDICGKGLSAAAISFTCYSLINQVIKRNIKIHQTAKMINEILVTEYLFNVENFFLTLSGISINTSTLESEIVNCGNPPVILFDGKEVYEINPKGTILGIFDNVEIETFKFKLTKDTLILMFSDGITDVMKSPKEISTDEIEYIKNLVKSIKVPQIIWSEIMNHINKYKEKSNLLDDVTISMIYVD